MQCNADISAKYAERLQRNALCRCRHYRVCRIVLDFCESACTVTQPKLSMAIMIDDLVEIVDLSFMSIIRRTIGFRIGRLGSVNGVL